MTPTQEQLNKLPKWAQDHIRDIQRQRDIAVQHDLRFGCLGGRDAELEIQVRFRPGVAGFQQLHVGDDVVDDQNAR